MNTPEQVTAPNYPENESQIWIGPTEGGMLNQAFLAGIRDHGNGDQLTWQSYSDSNIETFTVRWYGDSVKDITESDGFPMSKWILDFEVRQKSLLIDAGSAEVLRFDSEFTVPASYQDISDLVAAYFNLNAMVEERQEQGWNPLTDLMLRMPGYFE